MRVFVFIFAALAIVVGLVGYRWFTGGRGVDRNDDDSAADWIPDAGSNLTVYVGWPTTDLTEWKRASSFDRSRIQFDDGTAVAPHEVESYLVVYPNGEMLRWKDLVLPLPPGIEGLKRTKHVPETTTLDADELALGKKVCAVSHKRVRVDNQGLLTYATTLENRSIGLIRIRKFAAFRRDGERYQLSTVSGDYFSAEQFAAWYATPPDGWIRPGERAVDDSNYGGGDGLWAYFGETEDGRRFIATAPTPEAP